jgi:hypothetical protein
MSSGGGGKGGGKKTTTETTVPEWVRAPADRNLQRAEALQQIEYMPYYGAEVAAFNDNQSNAMQNNANAASAFGLLAPTDAMAGMPTPTTFANGMKGYNSMPLYDQAMTDLKANYGDTVDAYDSLFGNAVPTNAAPQYSGRGGGGGGGGFVPPGNPGYSPQVTRMASIMDAQDKERDRGTGRESGVTQAQNYYRHASPEINPQNKGKTSMGTGKNYAMSYNPLTGRGGF